MKILVVDDNPPNRKVLRILLTQESHAVLEVEDGLEALHALERENIDAVISDILMPRMEATAFVTKSAKTRNSIRFHLSRTAPLLLHHMTNESL
jgi:CheY-like chemotaxis protein